MTSLSASDFGAFHAAVHGDRLPFAWQQRLLDRIVADKAWPRVLDLPTGAGKTTCIDVALFALALDAANPDDQRWCPRRIAMIVDRRIVVDQVAERGRTLLRALMTSTNDIVVAVANRLRSLTRTGEQPLGVFTLRGGMPKDDGWARTPDQPLVIASTVDQVGSRMLMQGYGVSQGMKPVHAGLLANDTLMLLDEVHLSEPFRQTLDQLARLRTRFSDSSLSTRFSHVFLSATPGAGDATPFTLVDDEKGADSPLGPRLHASKPARLVEVGDRTALEKTCVDQARALLERHRTIAVVVNRLASAAVIARQLAEILGADALVTLLTGRMRPLDRDDALRELRPAVQTGRQRRDDSPKRVVVGTQCIEAGADFDFDALVTEAASLDSLRQRFGRVDRLGSYGRAEGVIVWDTRATWKEELKRRGDPRQPPSSADLDPIYGKALVETAKWFSKKVTARRPTVDFGVLALDVPVGEELAKLLAPKPSAPTLLPAYLDMWVQTSPAPSRVPEVGLWLHGPASGPADVQVVWRADLTEEALQLRDVEAMTAIVGAARPSSLEAMSLPFVTAREWLANQAGPALGDTEGATPEDNDAPRSSGRGALRWQGDESEIVDATSLRPGDTIVVPASYGGVRNGCFDAASTEPVSDRAEQAGFFGRAHPMLRVHPLVLQQLGLSLPLDEVDESRAALRRLASSSDWPAWKRMWALCLAGGRASFVVPADSSWMVLEAKRVPIADLARVLVPEETFEDGVELTTDGDDSFCAGRAVSLSEHSADVERLAREYATRAGLGSWLAEHVALAAWLHDIGKADRRFQLMLRGGSEVEFFKDETPWAKSTMPPGARAQRRLARQRSGYPGSTHLHAVQSVAMVTPHLDVCRQLLRRVDAKRDPDLDLVLHLIASHHGACRPFAPVSADDVPVDVSLDGHESAAFGSINFTATTSNNSLHRVDSPLADRFWGLVGKYGWQELCWLEAILRLADHRASEEEQAKP